MYLKPLKIRGKVTSKGENVIAFSVSDEDYNFFMVNLKNNVKYGVNFTRISGEISRKQQDLFYSLIRLLARARKYSFDMMKHYILTEYGIPKSEVVNGVEIPITLSLAKDSGVSVKAFQTAWKKNHHYYLKEIEGNEFEHRFLMFKGISIMTSKELWDVTDGVFGECIDQDIPVMSVEEYKQRKKELESYER